MTTIPVDIFRMFLNRVQNNETKEVSSLLSTHGKALLEMRDADGRSSLHVAALNGRHEVIKILLAADDNPNVTNEAGETPLLIAARGGHYTPVRQLLEKNADPNLADDDGDTPLICAVWASSPHSVKSLLDFDADARRANRHGRTALMGARDAGDLEIIQMVERRLAAQKVQAFTVIRPIRVKNTVMP